MTSLEIYDPAGTRPVHKLRRFSLAVKHDRFTDEFIFAEQIGVQIVAPWPVGFPKEAIFLTQRIRGEWAVRSLNQIGRFPAHTVIWRGQASDPLTALEAAAVSAGVDL